MQRATGQYDRFALVPRTGPRQGGGRRATAARHRCRTVARCTSRMELAVRSARIEPAIITARFETAFFASKNPKFPGCQTALPSKPCRGERNFWMQRRQAKNPPERPFFSTETVNVENMRKYPRRNGLFSIDNRFRGSGRLDGGRTRARTWDPMIKSHLLYQLSYAPGTGPEKPSQEGVV
jgi:hypothetical protein